nr:hypothetical protein [uncultured Methanoregula sp.]
MAVEQLKEALRLLIRSPALWIPGIAAGASAAILWILVMTSGTFFASRLLVLAGLILVLFIAGLLASIKENTSGPADLLRNGLKYYFRMLLPLLVVIFAILLIFFLLVATLSLAGLSSEPALIGGVMFGVLIPVLFFTFFFDTAAIFEDRPVFDAIKRSIQLVTSRFGDVIVYCVMSALVIFCILFPLMMVWEAFLYDKLEPLTKYTEAQIQAITPDQMLAILGKDSMGITAAVLFIAGLVLVPILFSYKACVFRKLASGTIPIEQQVTGEYDSKGRWYKY